MLFPTNKACVCFPSTVLLHDPIITTVIAELLMELCEREAATILEVGVVFENGEAFNASVGHNIVWHPLENDGIALNPGGVHLVCVQCQLVVPARVDRPATAIEAATEIKATIVLL
jgi:hypothetical protein